MRKKWIRKKVWKFLGIDHLEQMVGKKQDNLDDGSLRKMIGEELQKAIDGYGDDSWCYGSKFREVIHKEAKNPAKQEVIDIIKGEKFLTDLVERIRKLQLYNGSKE